MLLALHGHEQIFSMPNRDWLIELHFCKDAFKRRDLAARIAQDAAYRWAKVGSGKCEGMPPLINGEERKQLEHLGQEIDSLAGMIKTAEKLGVRRPNQEGAR